VGAAGVLSGAGALGAVDIFGLAEQAAPRTAMSAVLVRRMNHLRSGVLRSACRWIGDAASPV
jgi:hypothetical protein